MEVSTRLMSSDRQAGNQGKLRFVPTSKEIIEMELNLIDFSELIHNDFLINICDLSGGTGDQIHWTHEYLQEKGIDTEVYYNELSIDRYNQCVENYPYINALNCDFFSLRMGHKFNRALSKKVFSVIRNNPPYMYIERYGENVRAEKEFFLKNTLYNIDGGIQILEVPLHQLTGIKNFISLLCDNYEIFIAKFPREVFEQYKQVAIICKKKSSHMKDLTAMRRIINLIENDGLPYLDEITEKVMKVNKDDFKKAKSVDLFRNTLVTNKTMFNGLSDVIDDLLIAEKKAYYRNNTDEELKPIIELQAGHLSQLLSAGRFDGIMGNLLIRGGVYKEVVKNSVEENSEELITETEVIKPFLEINNKNGDIIFKDF